MENAIPQTTAQTVPVTSTNDGNVPPRLSLYSLSLRIEQQEEIIKDLLKYVTKVDKATRDNATWLQFVAERKGV